ncbi:uncharacterized protein [Physcomitrium patens]|uniref:uncharacterized protein isoform X1 n=1 Tax=Physcomitrium patens TaxID=3218 RepID=UPI003CCCB0F7
MRVMADGSNVERIKIVEHLQTDIITTILVAIENVDLETWLMMTQGFPVDAVVTRPAGNLREFSEIGGEAFALPFDATSIITVGSRYETQSPVVEHLHPQLTIQDGTTEDAQMARRLLRCLDGFIDKDAMTPYVSTACQPTRNLCDNGAALSASRTSFMAVVGILQFKSWVCKFLATVWE